MKAKQDSISNELAIVKEENNRILRENERISIEIDSVRENLKNQTVQMPVVTSNPKKSDEGYKSGESLKYLDENNQAPAAGYYLIIGSFGVEKNALNFKNKVIMNGMSNTALLLNTSKNVRNAYVFYSTNKSEVDAEKQKYIGKFNKIWILKLN